MLKCEAEAGWRLMNEFGGTKVLRWANYVGGATINRNESHVQRFIFGPFM